MSTSMWLLVLLLIDLISSLKQCNDLSECREMTITDDGVSCAGYTACAQSELIKSTEDISCTGSHSCYRSKLEAKGNIYCDGSSACYNWGGNGYIEGRIVACGGDQGCKYYRDNPITAKTLLYCGGSESCQNNFAISVGKRVYCNGRLSCETAYMKIGIYRLRSICFFHTRHRKIDCFLFKLNRTGWGCLL